MDAETVLAILGTSSVTWIIQFAVTRHFHRKDTDREHDKIVKKTLAAVTYSLISNEVDRLIEKKYAKSEERRSLAILYDAYKSNGWNGDMEARIEAVHNLPFRKEDICN